MLCIQINQISTLQTSWFPKMRTGNTVWTQILSARHLSSRPLPSVHLDLRRLQLRMCGFEVRLDAHRRRWAGDGYRIHHALQQFGGVVLDVLWVHLPRRGKTRVHRGGSARGVAELPNASLLSCGRHANSLIEHLVQITVRRTSLCHSRFLFAETLDFSC